MAIVRNWYLVRAMVVAINIEMPTLTPPQYFPLKKALVTIF
jgi:hypothetical protein